MWKKLIPVLFVLFLLIPLFNGSVRADVAPPLQPPGASPGPPAFIETNVSMDWESVTFRVGGADSLYYSADGFPAVNASVSATFLMVNYGEATETLEVVFPLMHLRGIGDGRFNYPEIQDFRVRVDGAVTEWETVETPNPNNANDAPIKWAQFPVSFPPEEVVFIDIDYDVQSTGYFPKAAFSYVLETGAGWAGPIRDAYLTLILPYEASEENVLVETELYSYLGGGNNPEPEWNGNQVTWNWKEFEPSAEDNWSVATWAPHIWWKIIELRDKAEKGEIGAAAELTRWYDGLIMGRGISPGAERFVELNQDMYRQAILEDPYNADVAARYANFILFLYDYGGESYHYASRLDTAYQYAVYAQDLDLYNATALDVLNQLDKVHQYDPPAEKTTPLLIAAAQTPMPTVTPVSTNPMPIKQDTTLITILGGALALAVVVIFILIYRMRSKKET